jgi:hypothetical protein
VEASSHHLPSKCLDLMEREFTDAFRGVYIPPELVEMKLGEFLALNQGTKIVTQYSHAFNNLCRYAPDMVDTDAKRNKRRITTRTLHPRLARGPLSQDHHSQESSLLIVLPIVHLHQVQDLGHHSIKPRTTRDRRSRIRWSCRQQR